jgi:D-arabinose 1-dehydrogenase-like Zn-dependent alcohol dehydrogenase
MQVVEAGFDRDLQEAHAACAPEPEGAWVRLRVEACGVCHRDLIDRDGRVPWMNYPVAPGHEACGVVEALGPDVTHWRLGDRVATFHRDACGVCAACLEGERGLCVGASNIFGITVDGAYATHLLAPQSALFAVPELMDARLAATLACTYGTAWRSLTRGGTPKAGDVVVVVGAHGGVGRCAVELAHRLGCEVVAVVRREDDAGLRGLGADHVVVCTDNRFHQALPTGPAQLVVDCVGAATFNASLRCLGVGGRVCVVGNIDASRTELQLGRMIVFGLTVVGSSGASEAELGTLLKMHEEQPFVPRFMPEYSLEEADQAMRDLRQGGGCGRRIIRPLDPGH